MVGQWLRLRASTAGSTVQSMIRQVLCAMQRGQKVNSNTENDFLFLLLSLGVKTSSISSEENSLKRLPYSRKSTLALYP